MNYSDSISYLESLSPTLTHPDVARIKQFLHEVEDPQNSTPAFHVAGTNGKGSTVAILDSILRSAGCKVGRFTGPHLLRWNERFHVDGKPISDESFARVATQVRKLSEDFGARHPEHGCLTWFEFLTAMAFFHFQSESVQFAVLEVGLGGRFDATNVVSNVLCSIITTIDFDHTQILGKDLASIAFEKSGIIKPGVPVVTGALGEPLDVIRKRAAEIKTELTEVNADGFPPHDVLAAIEKQVPPHSFGELLDSLVLLGSHQRLNAGLALTALSVSKVLADKEIGWAALSSGLKEVFWPGRMQVLPEHRVILDGAHNPGGTKVLRAALDAMFGDEQNVFVVSCFDNKDVAGILKQLLRPGDYLFAGRAKTKRAACSQQRIAEVCDAIGANVVQCETIDEAFGAARTRFGPDKTIVATGSFATVKEVMQLLGWVRVEDGLEDTLLRFDDQSDQTLTNGAKNNGAILNQPSYG